MKFEYSKTDGLSIFKGIRTRDAVRKRIGVGYKTYAKTEFSENSTDVFGESMIKIWYSANDEIEGVQLYHPEAQFFYHEKQLLGIQTKELNLFFAALKQSLVLESDGTGFNARNNAIRFYVPELDELEESAKIECVYLEIPQLTMHAN